MMGNESDRINVFLVSCQKVLNAKVNHYGVQIMNVKITDVKLPTELQHRLERTTAFKTKMGEQEKTHENRVRVLSDEATKVLETIRMTNARQIQELAAEHERYDIEREEILLKARGKARVKEIEAVTAAETALTKAKGDEKVMVIKTRKDGAAKVKDAEVQAQKMKIEAETVANTMITQSEAALRAAKSTAFSMIAQAEAEAEGAEALAEKRKYELEWARLAVLEDIAGSGRRYITGSQGEDLLNNLVPTTQA